MPHILIHHAPHLSEHLHTELFCTGLIEEASRFCNFNPEKIKLTFTASDYFYYPGHTGDHFSFLDIVIKLFNGRSTEEKRLLSRSVTAYVEKKTEGLGEDRIITTDIQEISKPTYTLRRPATPALSVFSPADKD